MYDVLRVTDPIAEGVVDLNRNGHIHLHGDSNGVSWADAFASNSSHDLVKQLEQRRGWPPHLSTPATTPTSLVYRLISRLL